ncbi:MAG: MotA/TolQ/ExbB proton channel family protein [Bacteroidota bacterium]
MLLSILSFNTAALIWVAVLLVVVALYWFSTKDESFKRSFFYKSLGTSLFAAALLLLAASIQPNGQEEPFGSIVIYFLLAFLFFFGISYLWLIYSDHFAMIRINRAFKSDFLSLLRANSGNLDQFFQIIQSLGDGQVFDTTENDPESEITFHFNYPLTGVYVLSYLKPILLFIQKSRSYSAILSHKEKTLEKIEDSITSSFAFVRWAEIALPTVGFLGTVMGMSAAIGAMDPKVLLDATSGQQAIENMFGQMAFAFNTTFLGLGGLLIIGFAHIVVKKRLSMRLVEIDNYFDLLINEFSGHSLSLEKKKRTDIDFDALMILLEERFTALTAVEEETSSLLLHTRHMVEKVIFEVPSFQKIKDVLFDPIIEFNEKTEGLNEAIEEFFSQSQIPDDKWEFTNLWCPKGYENSCLIGINAQKNQYLLECQLTEEKTIQLFSSTYSYESIYYAFSMFIGNTAQNEAHLFSLPKHKVLTEGPSKLKIKRKFISSSNGRIVAVGSKQIGKEKYFILFRLDEDLTIELYTKGQNPIFQYRFEQSPLSDIHTFDHASQTLYVLDKSNDLGSPKKSSIFIFTPSIGIAKGAGPIFLSKAPNQLWLPEGVSIANIYALERRSLLLLTKSGKLFYWNPKLSSIIELKNSRWESFSAAPFKIRVGLNGWIAVSVKEKLSIWKVNPSGQLWAYEELLSSESLQEKKTSFSVSEAISHSMVTTSDGSYILGLDRHEKEIAIWQFPVVESDISK